MASEIRGKFVSLLQSKSGTGTNGQWVIQEFLLETTDQFPKKICFEAWNDKANIAKSITPGTEIQVAFNPESREYNGRWYTSLKVWKIDIAGNSVGQSVNQVYENRPPLPTEPPPMSDGDLPF